MSTLDDAVVRQELEDVLANYVRKWIKTNGKVPGSETWPETIAIFNAGIEILKRDGIGNFDVCLTDVINGKKVVCILDLETAKPWNVTAALTPEMANDIMNLVVQYLKDGKKIF